MTRSGRRLAWVLATACVVLVALFAYEVWGPGPTDFAGGARVSVTANPPFDPTGVPSELAAHDLIARGEYLAQAADCMACHTAKGGEPYAGGRAFVLPFGTLYSTNITPDRETGIGRYSDAEFLDAVHRGIGRGGTRLYPAMPFASYTYMSDGDALAIKAFLFSRKPVAAAAPANTLSFPFNQRALMGIWSLLFNADRRFEVRTAHSAEWNRGAYLVEALGHCGECHTPRNLLFALDQRSKFAGAIQAGWRAYNITPDPRSGLGAWSDAELAAYLSSGHADGRGTAAGPMGEAVDASLSHLTAGDIAAMVAYLRSVPAAPTPDLPTPRATPAALDPAADLAHDAAAAGRSVYEGACVGCHGWSGVSPVLPLATLTGARAVNDPTSTNVAQVILSGGQRSLATNAENMPAFGAAYSDAEIASLANYVTARFGAQASNLDAADIKKMRREN